MQTYLDHSIRFLNQGCRVGVEIKVGGGRSGLLLPESESQLESLKYTRLCLRPESVSTFYRRTIIVYTNLFT